MAQWTCIRDTAKRGLRGAVVCRRILDDSVGIALSWFVVLAYAQVRTVLRSDLTIISMD